ncbi:leucine-rich repeat receptor protein kinase HPCA1-like isoform X2 [Salvia splendens]|uniref:leucine-rich repeat receptor protein kinase HPCA1-like isoform X2 n=1 Tax=Salvia splendens TaxID=180675 RepID=UPI001C27EA9F|nr:leucine-rich repeat receptor protein kinase HPCA1-like isoform X2 [Salvia splendens]
MLWPIHLSCLLSFLPLLGVVALTNTNDFVALKALMSNWDNHPPNWNGADPCGSGWDGITCTNDRVQSITLASLNLSGQLASDIEKLSELQILDLSYNKGITGELPSSIGNLNNLTSLIVVGCGFSGQIPPSIGSLQKLVYLSLNLNNFVGQIPASIGNIPNLFWLDIADNKLTGSIPVSKGSTPGLDMLVTTKHFHFGGNLLSGEIPSQLFTSELTLKHLIPTTLGLVRSLEVIRLDRNLLIGAVPGNLNNLSSVQTLHLENNKLTGPLPNLTSMDSLNYADLSNNSFEATDVPPWFSSLQYLTSLIMENTHIRGELPDSLFSLSQLQTVLVSYYLHNLGFVWENYATFLLYRISVLRRNQINGTLTIGSNRNNQLKLIDLQNNFIDAFPASDDYSTVEIILVGNPICEEGITEDYCTISNDRSNDTYTSPQQNCTPLQCSKYQILSPTCQCAYPYSGTLTFRAPSFSNYGNNSVYESLEQALMKSFKSHNQPVDSVSLSSPVKDSVGYFQLHLDIFPYSQLYFNWTGIERIGFMLSNQTFKPPHEFGPFVFHGNAYQYFAGYTAGSHKSSISTGVIIGATLGAFVLLLLLLVAGVYAFRQKKIAKSASKRSDPFGSWDPKTDSGGVPQLKGGRSFTFEEIKKFTNNFSTSNEIGSGGYGKVYRGTLVNGQLVAIKRAQQGSTQGALEFKTEIELLSRVHHKNVVGLVGFCFDKGEQMLVYEYITNGTLKNSLTGKTGIRLDWSRRLKIALGAGRGVHYLHEEANPPVIHRDIKSNNILLDHRLNAKVADFGLSKCKPMSEQDKSHLTTNVKGTMGYLDPEYYMTQQLTEKSDVYSFGVVMLELLTSRTPIAKGKYIVREIKKALDKSKNLYNLEAMLDPIVASNMAPGSVERFVEMALRCVEESGSSRPNMSEVVKEIEKIMDLAGLNPSNESASTSDNYEGTSKGSKDPYANESLLSYSGSESK